MYKKILFSVLMTLLVVVLGFTVTPLAAESEKPLSFHILLPNSPTDGGWNQKYYEDTQRLIKAHPEIDITYTLEFDEASAKSIVQRQATAGIDVIFHELGVWYAAADIVGKYPNTRFACENAVSEMMEGRPSNVFGYCMRQEQGGYLAGMVAAMTTKTNKLAYVAGMDYPDIVSIGYGFAEGARSVNPDVTLSVVYTGSWVDVKAGYEAARTVIDMGCDVILMFADQGDFGIIDAAKEQEGVYLIGEARDQRYLAPKQILTSYNIAHLELMEAALKDAINKTQGPKSLYLGLQEGVEVLLPYGPMVTAETKARVEGVKAKIKSGEFVVPYVVDAKRLEDFK